MESFGTQLASLDLKSWLALAGAGIGAYHALRALGGLPWVVSPSHPTTTTRKLSPQSSPALATRYFQSPSTGLWLSKRIWRVPEPKGLVVICHGFCDHIGRYELMARSFNKMGLACAGLDVEGHGLSRGTRGFIKSWKGVLQDLLSFLPHAKTEAEVAPDAPLFVLGHSMGGTFALALADALEQSGTPPSGLVLSAPMVEVDPAVATPFLRAMQGIVNATIPGIVVQQIENKRVCNNKAVVADYDEDRAGCPGDVYASTGVELLALVEHVRERVHRMKVPIQVHHADTDALTDYHASKRLLQAYGEGKKMEAPGAATGGAASSEQSEGSSDEGSSRGALDKEFVSVEDGSGHELMFEKNGPTHLARMCAWVKSRLSGDE